jgi:PhnB protein
VATKKSARRKKSSPPRRSSAKRAAKKARKRSGAAKRKVSAVPKGYTTATPYLIVRGCAEALAFYADAFGAKEKVRMAGPGGRIMHAEMKVGDSMIMLSDEAPQWGAMSPLALGGNATHVMLYVKDVDAVWSRAIAAGATAEMPLSNMFWGDRYGKVKDPYGHSWSLATHVEDVGPKEMQRRSAEFAEQMAEMAAK